MQLTDTTKKELKNLLRQYRDQDIIVDENFINEAMTILNADKGIDGKVKYDVKRKVLRSHSKYENGVNYFDVSGIRFYVSKFPDRYYEVFDEDYAGVIANIYALYVLLHDTFAITHRLGLTGFEELDHAYHDLYQRLDNLSKVKLISYLKSRKCIVVDRNADVEAFRELIDINQLSNVRLIPNVQYLKSLLTGYENGVSSPMRTDFDYLGLDYDKYDFSNIPFLDALEHGVSEDGENITRASELRADYYENRKAFDDVYKELRKVQ